MATEMERLQRAVDEPGDRKRIINRVEILSSVPALFHTPEVTQWVQGAQYTGVSRSEPKSIEQMKLYFSAYELIVQT
jgi:hypothetical protein